MVWDKVVQLTVQRNLLYTVIFVCILDLGVLTDCSIHCVSVLFLLYAILVHFHLFGAKIILITSKGTEVL